MVQLSLRVPFPSLLLLPPPPLLPLLLLLLPPPLLPLLPLLLKKSYLLLYEKRQIYHWEYQIFLSPIPTRLV
jgi:hypothetical protein